MKSRNGACSDGYFQLILNSLNPFARPKRRHDLHVAICQICSNVTHGVAFDLHWRFLISISPAGGHLREISNHFDHL